MSYISPEKSPRATGRRCQNMLTLRRNYKKLLAKSKGSSARASATSDKTVTISSKEYARLKGYGNVNSSTSTAATAIAGTESVELGPVSTPLFQVFTYFIELRPVLQVAPYFSELTLVLQIALYFGDLRPLGWLYDLNKTRGNKTHRKIIRSEDQDDPDNHDIKS
nr:hypothetical protein [Tanacetum cinerariifolium]